MRRDVRAAIEGGAGFAGITVLVSWAQSVDAETLPVLGVFTPRERSRKASSTDVLRDTDVAVQLRRAGGDELEDLLDDDSALIEALVLPVLAAHGAGDHQLELTDIEISGEGARRIGKLNMTFRAARFTSEGSPE
ncbi:hypothetical protein K3722_07490 [Leisingera caerulea]|uniref:Tail terminator n=1 Tax=Leisingera caerulea TaxID=506591 RepID=A0ABY5X0E7_LEICA|nr:hypothetical protein [Leisingera caerulea]UWQ59964.1 hypothetical protein K3722_07490 [Leisingera caerulea]